MAFKLSSLDSAFADEDVSFNVQEWGHLFLITKNGRIFQLDEKDTATKLDMLFEKHLFTLAINMAQNQLYDTATTAEIYKRYGDYLYEYISGVFNYFNFRKNDFDAAMSQFMQTIGVVEPSYVIRKVL